jgi:hypothetical protein
LVKRKNLTIGITGGAWDEIVRFDPAKDELVTWRSTLTI